MTQSTASKAARLEAVRTFVVQLRSDSELQHRRLCGRVEHVMSGDSAQFASLAELLDFMARHATTKEESHDEP